MRPLGEMAVILTPNTQDVMKKTGDANLTRKPGTITVNVDFDLLVNSVETSIMADHVEQTTQGLDPRQLLLKSNPGIYGANISNTRDLTNPREMYSILSYKTKSTEDLAAKLKQDLAKSLQSSGMLPKLSRTSSMHDFRRNPARSDRLNKIPFQSSTNVNEDRLENDQTALRRNKTSVVDTRRKLDPEEKENCRVSNLPSISRNVHTSGGEKRLTNAQTTELPDLTNDGRKRSADRTGLDIKHAKQHKRLIQIKEELSASDTKLDKWFSEMPNEVFDKAQRALMEESIKERLQNYQAKRNKRNGFPNDNVHVYVGSKVRKVPNTFLELRVDSFGKHLLDNKGDKMNKYKLQQKSMHKLKMRDLDELDKIDRIHDEIEYTPRLSLHHRSLTTLALTKAKTATTMARNKTEYITIPTDRALNTININESVELEESRRERKQMSYFEEYTERLNMMKLVADQHDGFQMARPNSAESNHDHEESDKGTAKATIVNIALEEPASRKRNTGIITKFTNEPEFENVIDHDDCDGNNNLSKTVNLSQGTEKKTPEQTDNLYDRDQAGGPIQGTIITMIPTAPTNLSSRTSTSSSIRSLANKSPLKKFNTLEVFAEHNKALEAKMEHKNYHGHKLKDPAPRTMPPTVRLDLKQYPHQARNPLKNLEIERNEVKMQDVVFRFEPGEVFISTNKSKQNSTSYNRSSERARIIYGKALMKDEKKEGRIRENSKENFSTVSISTRLDGYKSELGRFESRALDGSITSMSEQVDIPTNTPITYINDSGVLSRDIAIETDVLGSEKSHSAKPIPDINKLTVEQTEIRTGSGLTDFIMDDNDGESLDSTSENGELLVKKSDAKSDITV